MLGVIRSFGGLFGSKGGVMSESVRLDVYFRTDNPLPEIELRGIFKKYFQELSSVRRVEGSDFTYNVVIHELALLETTEDILKVITHCHKNGREITVNVTHGCVWRH
ncbi:hypothetical protein NVP1101O_062 [Vibrio phage 1.101.O._10N.261.45.C6]|nr:hypothetical protein NVP1101O_062 [Vibrio phage 1.101.O._10N.261.45.C6]